jgi:hypothetical protein
VGIPAQSSRSFTPKGTPASGGSSSPARRAASTRSAAASAPSASTCTNALRRACSASSRSSDTVTSSRADTSPRRTDVASSIALGIGVRSAMWSSPGIRCVGSFHHSLAGGEIAGALTVETAKITSRSIDRSRGGTPVTLTRPSDNRPSDDDVLAFLRAHHGAEPTDLELLSGGFWSAAFGYRIGDDEFVLRDQRRPRRLPVGRGGDGVRRPRRCPCRRCSRSARASAAGSRSRAGTTVGSSSPSAPDEAAVLGLHRGRPARRAALGARRRRTHDALAGVPARGTDRSTRHHTTAGWRARARSTTRPSTARSAPATLRVRDLLDACPGPTRARARRPVALQRARVTSGRRRSR